MQELIGELNGLISFLMNSSGSPNVTHQVFSAKLQIKDGKTKRLLRDRSHHIEGMCYKTSL